MSAVLCFSPCLFCLARFRIESLSRFCLLLFLLPAIHGLRQGLLLIHIRRLIAIALAGTATLAMALLWNMIPRWILNWALILPVWYLVCPAQAIRPILGSDIAELDAVKCTRFHQELVAENRWPCGVCSKVCAIGEDRKLYGSTNVCVYLKERETIAADPSHPDYRHLVHMRTHGSDGDRKY